mgnify:CR=1 FL=1
MLDLKNKIIEVVEANGWSVYIEDESESNICFDFGKYSPAGQDFHVSAELENNEPDTLTDNLYARYSDFDVSSETYLWLDNDGHGKNGAPYDMKDLYEDMEACQEMIMDLYNIFNNEDWSEYYENNDSNN